MLQHVKTLKINELQITSACTRNMNATWDHVMSDDDLIIPDNDEDDEIIRESDEDDLLIRARTAEPNARLRAAWDWVEKRTAIAMGRFWRAERWARDRGERTPEESERMVEIPLDILKLILHDGYRKEVTTGLPDIPRRGGKPTYTPRQENGIASCIRWAHKCWVRDGRRNLLHHADRASRDARRNFVD